MSPIDWVIAGHQRPAAAFGRIIDSARRPVHALPLDLLRIVLGGTGLVYFLDTLRSSPEFSSPDGFIDHELMRDALWYTRLSVFPTDIGLGVLQAALAAACSACVLLVAGYRPRLMATFTYVVAVSTYRWNFVVMYLDDAMIHLVFFWLMLLPTGTTLTVGEWRSLGSGSWPAWKQRWVSGVEVRCFMANIALLYLVAGLWKWTSPMWRDGTALYVGLQTPVSRAPDFWTPGWLPVLMVASYGALVLEPLLPAMFVLPANHHLKWMLLGGALVLHVGVIATLRIPYANALLIAVSIVTFREEIMQIFDREGRFATPPRELAPIGPRGVVAAGFVVLLTVAMLGEVTVPAWREPTRVSEVAAGEPIGSPAVASSQGEDNGAGLWGSGHNPFFAPLWVIGIAQSYRLFDWVDDRNWDVRYEVVVRPPDAPDRAEPSDRLFGNSIRHVLLQSYVHGVTWQLLGSDLAAFRLSVVGRYATHYCRGHRAPDGAAIDVFTLVRRITKASSVERQRSRELLMSFECRDERAALTYVSDVAG